MIENLVTRLCCAMAQGANGEKPRSNGYNIWTAGSSSRRRLPGFMMAKWHARRTSGTWRERASVIFHVVFTKATGFLRQADTQPEVRHGKHSF